MVDNALDRVLRDVMGMTDTEYMAWRGYMIKEDEVNIIQFKEECLEKNTVVHLITQEQYDEFSKWLDSKGRRWRSGYSYLKTNNWHCEKHKTCLCPNISTFDNIDYYKDNGYKILSYEEALLKPPISNNSKEAEAIKLLPTKVLVIMLYNHVCSEEQYLEEFFEQVEKELKFRLDDYDSLCWAMAEDTLSLWLEENQC